MKKIEMKGRSVNDAVDAAIKVLGGSKDEVKVKVIKEGKHGMLGMIGSEEAEVEVTILEGVPQDAKQVLQEILDKMGMLTKVEILESTEAVELNILGDDMGRIIGKDGLMLKSLETLVRSIISKAYNQPALINVDAGEYGAKRRQSLERLAKEVADEVSRTGRQKAMPHLDARDRRIIHSYFKDHRKVTTFSEGEGRERKLIIAPK